MRFPNPVTEIPTLISSRLARAWVGLLLLTLLPVEGHAIWPFDADPTEPSGLSAPAEYPEISTFLSEVSPKDLQWPWSI